MDFSGFFRGVLVPTGSTEIADLVLFTLADTGRVAVAAPRYLDFADAWAIPATAIPGTTQAADLADDHHSDGLN